MKKIAATAARTIPIPGWKVSKTLFRVYHLRSPVLASSFVAGHIFDSFSAVSDHLASPFRPYLHHFHQHRHYHQRTHTTMFPLFVDEATPFHALFTLLTSSLDSLVRPDGEEGNAPSSPELLLLDSEEEEEDALAVNHVHSGYHRLSHQPDSHNVIDLTLLPDSEDDGERLSADAPILSPPAPPPLAADSEGRPLSRRGGRISDIID